MIVKEYRKCDICGRKIEESSLEGAYIIEPTVGTKLKMSVKKYMFGDPYEYNWWCNSVDICPKCWGKMKGYIIEKLNEADN